MALTATATARVRTDILSQLHLRDPGVYVASFNRPNLTYRVLPRSKGYDQTLEFIQARPRECGIVYCQSRKSAESLAERLGADGVKARPYHAGLESQVRGANQELFLRDEVRVICATVAFGMGINKPNVRFVIHHDLPKNVEGYYQETGRAGRDGLPGECLLLFSAGDVVKYEQFIKEKPPAEQQVARDQLRQIVHYAEDAGCRRASLLRYFGEEFGEPNCGACDNCLSPRDTYDGTLLAQKLLSCVYRIREKSGFGVGLGHVVEVLTGADTEKVRKWGHHELTTYGIGREQGRSEWSALGRELIRLGHLVQRAEQFNTLAITPAGLVALKQRQRIMLTRPMEKPEPARSERERQASGAIACDEALFERLRALRKRLADERAVPPYIIFSDVALRQMARLYPSSPAQFLRISGVGEKKLAEFGDIFLRDIAEFLAVNPRQIFADDSFAAPAAPSSRGSKLPGTVLETLRLYRAGVAPEEIAKRRLLVSSTIYGHLAAALEAGESVDLRRCFNADHEREMAGAFARSGFGNLTGAHEALGGRVDMGMLRVFRAAAQRGLIPA